MVISNKNIINQLFEELSTFDCKNFGSICDPNIIMHFSDNTQVSGLDAFKKKLNDNIFSRCASFSRTIDFSITEEFDTEQRIAVRSFTKAAFKDNPNQIFEFYDFTFFKINKDNCICELWQGAGTFYHFFNK